MYIKLTPYIFLLYTLLFHFIVGFVIFPFPIDESKTPEYIFSWVEVRKTL